MRAFLVALAAALSLAGCADVPAPADDLEAEAPAAPVLEWVNSTVEGSVTSVNALAVAVNPGLVDPNLHPFQVPADTLRMTLRFSGSAALPTTEAQVIATPPGCDFNTDCELRQTTSGLEAEIEADGPETGEWTLRVFQATPGADRIQFKAEVLSLVQVPCPAGGTQGGAAASEEPSPDAC